MKVIGRMTYSMDMALKLGLMVLAMRGTIKMARSMERVLMYGVMAHDMWVTGLTTR